MTSLQGLKAVRLVFFCSVAVSFVQLILYHTIVLNAKHTQDKRYPWQLEQIDIVKERTVSMSVENESIVVNTSNILQEKAFTPRLQIQFKGNPRACNLIVETSEYYRFPTMTSDLSEWSFTKRRICPSVNVKNRIKTTRMKFTVNCSNNVVSAKLKPTFSSEDIQRFHPDDGCLKMFVQKCCSDSLPVPNVVHYVWYRKRVLSFIEFISFMSVLRFVRPCAIFIHGDMLPSGMYWDFIVNMYPNIVHVIRTVKTKMFNKKVQYAEHNGDVWKIKALLRFGGIYMDTDTLLVKPIEPLRHFPCTLTRQSKNVTVSSAFIMAERNTTFVREWLDWYKVYYVNDSYTYNAMIFPSHLANRHPRSVHLEYGTVSRPNDQQQGVIFNTNTDWSNIYGIHLFARTFTKYLKVVDENNVKFLNTTVGAICRHILFGNKELCT